MERSSRFISLKRIEQRKARDLRVDRRVDRAQLVREYYGGSNFFPRLFRGDEKTNELKWKLIELAAARACRRHQYRNPDDMAEGLEK